MRRILALLIGFGLVIVFAAPAKADVVDCGAQQPLGYLTCTTTGPAMVNGLSFAGDGGSSAQYQWVGSMVASGPGTLEIGYTYTGVFNSLFSKIGTRLTTRQPGCGEPVESQRDWLDPAVDDGVAQRTSVRVSCAGEVDYTITARAATYSLGGSFVGQLSQPTLIFTPDSH